MGESLLHDDDLHDHDYDKTTQKLGGVREEHTAALSVKSVPQARPVTRTGKALSNNGVLLLTP